MAEFFIVGRLGHDFDVADNSILHQLIFLKRAFLGVVPMDNGTKYRRIAGAMRRDDVPHGVTMGVERCERFD